jgi:outer membrane protein assembly factor BamB
MRIFLMISVMVSGYCMSWAQGYETERTFAVEKAEQGVAVDKHYLYVINNTSVAKYTRHDGVRVSQWADTTGLLKHLNSGIVLQGKLYCAHSNYPASPMASSIEIFDTKTLTHTGSHSFGIYEGSATWIDRYKGFWYVGFAHYTGRGSTEGKDNAWTRVVKFNTSWQPLESWIFPAALIAKFGTRSNSGGVFGADGRLYCTGHDNKEIYVLSFPPMGYTLQWLATFSAPFEGQGIALDKHDKQLVLYGIDRENATVIKATKLK